MIDHLEKGPQRCTVALASPTYLLTELWADPGSVSHGLEELHLQFQKLLVKFFPLLPSQQELEDAPLGDGVGLLHVRGKVAVRESCLFLPVIPPDLGGTQGETNKEPQRSVWQRFPEGGPRKHPLQATWTPLGCRNV